MFPTLMNKLFPVVWNGLELLMDTMADEADYYSRLDFSDTLKLYQTKCVTIDHVWKMTQKYQNLMIFSKNYSSAILPPFWDL